MRPAVPDPAMTATPPPSNDQPDRDEALRRFVAATSGDDDGTARHNLGQWADNDRRRDEIARLETIAADARALAASYPLPPKKSPWGRGHLPWLAAGLTACALAAAVVLAPPRLVEAGDHRVARLDLGDGIHADLDAGAAVLVPRQPWDHSVTMLRGEALFDVRHDGDRAFLVRAGRAVITDLGTRFLVRHNGEETAVAVFAGEVEITAPTTAPGRVTAGQAAMLAGDAPLRPLAAPDEQEETAWRVGRVVFRDRPLAEVARRLSRYSPRPIIIGHPDVAGLRVSGTFGINGGQDAVRALEQVLPVRAVQRSDATVLEPAPAPAVRAPRLVR